MKKELKEILGAFLLPYVSSILVCAITAGLILLDIAVFKQKCNEAGVVELTQSAFLLIISGCLAVMAKVRLDLRAGLILASGFFLTMFIRENDQWFDLISHGCWLYPALVITAIACWLAFLNRETILPSILRICKDKSLPTLTLGFSIVLVFSRIFGMKPIWRVVVGADDYRPAKHVAEEGCELLGYAVILLWAITLCWSLLKEYRSGQK